MEINNNFNFIDKSIYNFLLRKYVKAVRWWFEQQDLKELEISIKKNEDLVQSIKTYICNDNLKQFNTYLRKSIANYLPNIQKKLVNEVLNIIMQSKNYNSIIKNNRDYLQDILMRATNILIVKLKEDI